MGDKLDSWIDHRRIDGEDAIKTETRLIETLQPDKNPPAQTHNPVLKVVTEELMIELGHLGYPGQCRIACSERLPEQSGPPIGLAKRSVERRSPTGIMP